MNASAASPSMQGCAHQRRRRDCPCRTQLRIIPEIPARALKLDPSLGRHGRRVLLLTLGGNYPIAGFHNCAQDFRGHLRELAIEPSVDWIECQARKDVMNFFKLDPIGSLGIDVGDRRRNPTIIPVRFREVIRPEHYNLWRWQLFRVHFQFVMANERPHAYDFFIIDRCRCASA